jgi:hypothetical protein
MRRSAAAPAPLGLHPRDPRREVLEGAEDVQERLERVERLSVPQCPLAWLSGIAIVSRLLNEQVHISRSSEDGLDRNVAKVRSGAAHQHRQHDPNSPDPGRHSVTDTGLTGWRLAREVEAVIRSMVSGDPR